MIFGGVGRVSVVGKDSSRAVLQRVSARERLGAWHHVQGRFLTAVGILGAFDDYGYSSYLADLQCTGVGAGWFSVAALGSDADIVLM
eukprot:2480277-Amphidinium_carterae.1